MEAQTGTQGTPGPTQRGGIVTGGYDDAMARSGEPDDDGWPPPEPVAWRYYRKDQTGDWRYTEKKPLLGKHPEDYEVQPLYVYPNAD